MQLLKSIKQKIDFVKANLFYGDPVAKKLIPQEYKLEYGAVNIFRVELSGFWRMLYTVKGTRIDIFVFILTISDHKKYDKMFGY